MDNQAPRKHKRRRWLIVVAAVGILVGLGQLIEAGVQSDRLVVFGD